jgi:hypothetical protein
MKGCDMTYLLMLIIISELFASYLNKLSMNTYFIYNKKTHDWYLLMLFSNWTQILQSIVTKLKFNWFQFLDNMLHCVLPYHIIIKYLLVKGQSSKTDNP